MGSIVAKSILKIYNFQNVVITSYRGPSWNDEIIETAVGLSAYVTHGISASVVPNFRIWIGPVMFAQLNDKNRHAQSNLLFPQMRSNLKFKMLVDH